MACNGSLTINCLVTVMRSCLTSSSCMQRLQWSVDVLQCSCYLMCPVLLYYTLIIVTLLAAVRIDLPAWHFYQYCAVVNIVTLVYRPGLAACNPCS